MTKGNSPNSLRFSIEMPFILFRRSRYYLGHRSLGIIVPLKSFLNYLKKIYLYFIRM